MGYRERALCDKDDCEQLARYVETGDGSAVRDPDKRCHGHQSSVGLWRDLAVEIGRDVHERYQPPGEAQ